MNIQSLKTNKYFWLLFTFIAGAFILCFRLTSSGLWYDECVEYYFSKYMTGTTPGFPEFSNMYERICFTGQPPLYNLLMWVWLRFCDSEVWFRLAGVVTTLFGSFAVFSFSREKSLFTAALSTLIYISAFPTRYFALECGEYNLLAANLAWMLYFFCRYLTCKDRKFYTGFLVFAVLSIYSQYGAAFVIIGCGISIFVFMWFHNKRDLSYLLVSGLLSLAVFILPLVKFFLLPQMENQGSKSANHTLKISSSLFWEFLVSIKDTFYYFFLRDQSALGKVCLTLLGLVFFISVLKICFSLKTKTPTSLLLRYSTISFFICYIVYFLAEKMNYYGRVLWSGYFGNHWALSIGLYLLIIGILYLSFLYNKKPILSVLICALILILHLTSLFTTNWSKDNVKEIVTQNIETLQDNTLYLTYTEIIPFSYYTREQNISATSLGKWTYLCENLPEEKRKQQLSKALSSASNDFYLLAGSEDSPDTITEMLSQMEYSVDLISAPSKDKHNLADMPMESYLYHIYK